MNSYIWGMLAGIAVGVMIVAIVKWRTRLGPMSITEKADALSKRRARMLPALAVIYLSQQASYLSWNADHDHRGVTMVKISAWLLLSAVLLAGIATKGFWLEKRAVRDLIDDELSQANRIEAMRVGFILAMAACIGVYILTMFEIVSGRDAVHIVLSVGLAAALIRWGWLERRAHRDA
jgi:hypothetical protein